MRQVYDLYMHNDVNTTQHTQWFYFGVTNMKAGSTVTFYEELPKPDSMFNEGMRPLLYSAEEQQGLGASWHEICYFHSPSTELDITQQQQQPTTTTACRWTAVMVMVMVMVMVVAVAREGILRRMALPVKCPVER